MTASLTPAEKIWAAQADENRRLQEAYKKHMEKPEVAAHIASIQANRPTREEIRRDPMYGWYMGGYFGA
jgi:hypothetical protein